MTERTKIIVLILSQTIVIAFDYAVEAMFGEFVELDLKSWVVISVYLSLYVGFGFITESTKQLFSHSAITALINIIFICSGMYFSPNDFQETLQTFGDSVPVLLCFNFALVFFTCLIFISLGRLLSYLLKVIFKKQANEF